ncbi:MAG: hypothetical protein VW644_05400 [Alphaproteobacteria bacterium]|jgi:hypothetical protein
MARQTKFGRRRLGLGALLAFLFAPDLAAADGACDGYLSGQSLEPLPAGAAFDVEVYDNSESNLELRRRFLEALRDAGKPVAEGGPLMICMISERLFPYYRPDTRAVGTPTTSATNDRLGINRQRTAIERLERAPRDNSSGPSRRFEEQIDVRFEVRDATTKTFVWLGQLSCTPLTDNRTEIVDSVFDAFIDNVGKSVASAAL